MEWFIENIKVVLYIPFVVASLPFFMCLNVLNWFKKCKSFEKNIVLITGGASGIGKELVNTFLEEKSVVIIWDVNELEMEKTVKMMKNKYPKCELVSMVVDVSNFKNVQKSYETVKSEYGYVDVIINNAGIYEGKNIFQESFSVDDIDRVIKVNVLSQIYLVKVSINDMIKSKRRKHITVSRGLFLLTDNIYYQFLSSMAGLVGIPNAQVYSCSKYANIGFAESLITQLQKDGHNHIDVSIICPFFVDTPMMRKVKGRKRKLLLNPQKVAKRIHKGMKNKENLVVLPKWFYSNIIATKAFHCSSALYYGLRLFGIDRFLNHYVKDD